jgi:hypothetical protein
MDQVAEVTANGTTDVPMKKGQGLLSCTSASWGTVSGAVSIIGANGRLTDFEDSDGAQVTFTSDKTVNVDLKGSATLRITWTNFTDSPSNETVWVATT